MLTSIITIADSSGENFSFRKCEACTLAEVPGVSIYLLGNRLGNRNTITYEELDQTGAYIFLSENIRKTKTNRRFAMTIDRVPQADWIALFLPVGNIKRAEEIYSRFIPQSVDKI